MQFRVLLLLFLAPQACAFEDDASSLGSGEGASGARTSGIGDSSFGYLKPSSSESSGDSGSGESSAGTSSASSSSAGSGSMYTWQWLMVSPCLCLPALLCCASCWLCLQTYRAMCPGKKTRSVKKTVRALVSRDLPKEAPVVSSEMLPAITVKDTSVPVTLPPLVDPLYPGYTTEMIPMVPMAPPAMVETIAPPFVYQPVANVMY
mmetsp:Transcript_42246/g.77375  ORF Transcript_42246/g.77375 Transcript_42246/m.77375 type:complete len:205 (-) Transcript_42246:100-714(-)